MSAIYLIGALGLLNGPIIFPEIPGVGVQLPSNAIQLASPLPEPAAGHEWAMVEGTPQQLADQRGTVYSTVSGGAEQHSALGTLPEGLTSKPRPSADHLWTGSAWAFNADLHAANQLARQASHCTAIDAAADAARKAVAGDPLRATEYERAAVEAADFKAAAYPSSAVPRTVAAWAINGRSAQQAADSILAEAAAYTEVLYQIREVRLRAKELIRSKMEAGETAESQGIAENAVADIKAIVTGVGNA